MARIIYSGLVTAIKGSIGGTTFQGNAYGFSVKNKANMIKPNSSYQNLMKLILSKATKGWGSITQTGRDNWNTFAATFPQYSKHNPTSILSGFAAFVKWHTAYFLGFGLSQAFDEAPVLLNTPLDTVSLALVNNGSTLVITPTWAIGNDAWDVNYFLSRPFSSSQYFVGTSPRFIHKSSSSDGPIDITMAYKSVFGSLPPVGLFVNFSLSLYDDNGGKVIARAVQRIIVSAT